MNIQTMEGLKMPISGANTVSASTAAEKVLGAPQVQRPEEETPQRKPVMDEYVPEEPQEPSGRYWLGRDEDGQPKIYFDDPERAAEGPEQANQGAKGPERNDGEEERWACDTGKADREIEKLKRKRQELEQQLNTETDEAKVKDLERQLTQVEQELKQKDNDTYRKQHAVFTQLS